MPSHIPSRSGFVQESEGNFNPEACCAAVRLAVDRLKMFDEDAAVANQVLRPLKKRMPSPIRIPKMTVSLLAKVLAEPTIMCSKACFDLLGEAHV